jgi:hypothetical protein
MKHADQTKPLGNTSAADYPEGSAGLDGSNLAPVTSESATAMVSAPASSWLTVLAAGLIVLATVGAYHNSLVGAFVYDDQGAIDDNPTIRQLWPIGPALSPPPDAVTVSGRPLLNLSLAINYAISGLNVRSYHAANLMIHIAAALLLFGILRRTFLLPVLRDRFGKAATPLALASALIWAVHPLQTESVTYTVQRAESLMGFFYLLTLYCVIRGAGFGWREGVGGVFAPTICHVEDALTEKDSRPLEIVSSAVSGEKGDCRLLWLWYAAAVLACLLGMACKEVMVTAPLIVLLYDRTRSWEARLLPRGGGAGGCTWVFSPPGCCWPLWCSPLAGSGWRRKLRGAIPGHTPARSRA